MNPALYTNFIGSISRQETQIDTLEQQIATGIAVNTPDQNPAAFEVATFGNDQINALTADATTQAAIQNQLGDAGNVYQSVGTLFDNVQSVVEQALNGTASPANLQSLATQIAAAGQQLTALGNTTGVDGTYLFGGSRNTIAPFQTNAAGGVIYFGDGGQSQAAISTNAAAATLSNGNVFTHGLSGDGFASVGAAAANTGSADIVSEGVANPAAAAAFQHGNAPITLSFANSTSGLVYTATQSGTTISSGPVAAGTSLQLAGTNLQLNGTPAAGDSFTISPSRPQTAFSLLQTIQTALAAAGGTPAQAAQTRQLLNNSLAGLAQYQQLVLTTQAQNGVTLQAVASAASSTSNQETQLQSAVQAAVGVDIPTAITTLNETVTAVQAALKAFGSVQNLSLFNYLQG